METKDLILLMLIPIILISISVYIDNYKSITGLIIYDPIKLKTQQEENNIIGAYSIIPSFKAKIDYDLIENFNDVNTKINKIINNCKDNPDIEKCFKENSKEFNCQELKDEAVEILYDFVDKFNECLNLKEDSIVCSFSLDDRELDRPIKSFDLILTKETQKIRVDLVEKADILKTEYINQEDLGYIEDYNTKDVISVNADQIKYVVDFEGKKPVIKQAIARYGSNNVRLSEILIMYKANNWIKFIDATQEGSFRIGTPANKIINLPKTKGFKFCAKTGKQFYVYDESDKTVKLRDIVYKFVVTYPKQSIPPKPIENLEAYDALKAENSVILTWDKSDEQSIKSFSIYYSQQNFLNDKIEDVKINKNINRKSILTTPIEIKDIDLKNCNINPIGTSCKYLIYGKPLEPDKLYYWSSKNKYIYMINDVKDGKEYNFAVTAANEEGIEIDNDKSIKDNLYILTLDKNYKKSISKDDLAPDKVLNLQGQSIEQRKVKLMWNKPIKNIDGSASVDITSFNIYYKKFQPAQFPEMDKIDITYTKKTITATEANCVILVDIDCEYTLEVLEQGQVYNIAITAIDKNSNEFTNNAVVIQSLVS